MTTDTDTPRATMARCLRALTDEHVGNLLYHAERGTPICCGCFATDWYDGEGGG